MKFADRLKILLLCSPVLVAACGLHDLHSPKNANDSGSAASAPSNANPLDMVTSSMKAQLDAKSFRVRLESSYDGRNTTQVIEYVNPDRIRMTGGPVEVIVVGSNTYTKLPTGQWQKTPMDVNQMLSSFRDPKIIDELRNSTNVQLVGTDTVDGMPMKVYQYTTTNAFGTNITTTSKAWIAASDNLPRKIESEGQINGKPSKSLVTYYDYNADIKIEPPM
ncbi:MAG TPA: hypothetical protein VJZ26_13655 [Blastocatellia bacterium]|nr:hypothetical protein [Blastocatellia bacterium]